MGLSPEGKAEPNGVDFWWDDFSGNTGNCWWDNTAAPGASVTTSPPLLPDCAGGTDPSTSVGTGDPVNENELTSCFAGYETSGYPNGDPTICSWTQTPPKPGSSPLPAGGSAAMQQAQAEQLATICGQGLSPRLCRPFQGSLGTAPSVQWPYASQAPAPLTGAAAAVAGGQERLSSYTCSWWRQADQTSRQAVVERLRHFATLPVDGATAYGYGAGMSDGRAGMLLNDRCSFFGAGPFALYKIYGAAAPFSAFVG